MDQLKRYLLYIKWVIFHYMLVYRSVVNDESRHNFLKSGNFQSDNDMYLNVFGSFRWYTASIERMWYLVIMFMWQCKVYSDSNCYLYLPSQEPNLSWETYLSKNCPNYCGKRVTLENLGLSTGWLHPILTSCSTTIREKFNGELRVVKRYLWENIFWYASSRGCI